LPHRTAIEKRSMRVDLFDFDLPPERIALRPAKPRDAARLLIIQPQGVPVFEDRTILDLPDYFAPGDVLAVNDTRVIRARLHGFRIRSGSSARIEATLIKRQDEALWHTATRTVKRLKEGDLIRFASLNGPEVLDAEVVSKGEDGEVVLKFALSGEKLDKAIEFNQRTL
jgi:S-adenosylmethionine:tRNA ribosyltransferase-isomerase